MTVKLIIQDSIMVNFVCFGFLIEFQLKFSDENKDDPSLAFGGSSVSFKQGRQLLRQYIN
jgi:hypothetical protein